MLTEANTLPLRQTANEVKWQHTRRTSQRTQW